MLHAKFSCCRLVRLPIELCSSVNLFFTSDKVVRFFPSGVGGLRNVMTSAYIADVSINVQRQLATHLRGPQQCPQVDQKRSGWAARARGGAEGLFDNTCY